MSTASYETVETANWVPIGRRQRRATCLTLFSGRPHEEPGVRIHLPPARVLCEPDPPEIAVPRSGDNGVHRGRRTEGSNPSPSSVESSANLIPRDLADQSRLSRRRPNGSGTYLRRLARQLGVSQPGGHHGCLRDGLEPVRH